MIKTLITLLLLLFPHQKESPVANTIQFVKTIAVYPHPVQIENYKPKEKLQTFEITSYTANRESTGKSPGDKGYGITASGEKVKEFHTAACPKSMEFGTKLYIKHFNKTFVCTDRGSAITEGHIDIYMKHLDDALDFGRRNLEVKIMRDKRGEKARTTLYKNLSYSFINEKQDK